MRIARSTTITIGLLRAVEAEAVGEALRLDDLLDARVLDELLHPCSTIGWSSMTSTRVMTAPQPILAFFARSQLDGASTGISTRMVVPFFGVLSTSHVPPSAPTRSVIVVKPKPFGVEAAIPLPLSLR